MLKEEKESPLAGGRVIYWRSLSTVHAWQSAVTLLDRLLTWDGRRG